MEFNNKINALTTSSAASRQTLMRYGPMVLTALLVIWCASKLASITWLILDKPTYDITTTAIAAPIEAGTDSGSGLTEQVSLIRNANLFGAYVAPPVGEVSATPIEEVPETDLRDLTLKGTVASTTDNNGLAVVERNGEENVYLVGDDIASGIELIRVFATEIHLSRNGRTEKLLLPKLSESAPVSGNRLGANTRASQRPAARQVASRAPSGNVPTKLGDLMRPQPVFQNGKMQGYRVYPGRKREQFKALGLKPGDLVTEVNGTPLEDPSKGLEIFRTLSENSQVSVTVQRNGAQTSLVLDTSQLNLGNQ